MEKKKNYIKGYTQKNNVNKNGILKKYSSNLQLGKKRKTQTLFQVGLGASSDEQAMVELRPVRQQSGFTHSGSLLLQGL